MGEAVNFATRLTIEYGCAVGLVHHPAKNAPNGTGRGSSVVLAGVDTEIRMSKEKTDNPDDDTDSPRIVGKVLTIAVAKQKDDECAPPFKVIGVRVDVVGPDGHALAHEDGSPRTSCVLRLAGAEVDAAKREALQKKEQQLDVQLLTLIQKHAIKNVAMMRAHMGGDKKDVDETYRRLLNEHWIADGGTGKPYTVTGDGQKVLDAAETKF